MKNLFALIIILVFSATYGQQEDVLPKNLTQKEKNLIKDYVFKSNLRTPPPNFSVRTMAEWEEIEYLVLSWQGYQSILRQIVAAAVNECKVLIATNNPSSVSSYLTQGGISLTNVEFINTNSNSIWMRDYAANTVYKDGVGDRQLVDWIYNRPRPLDDALSSFHATHTSTPLYITNSSTNDLVHTGGNFMSDGLGTAFSSNLILQENASGNPYGVSAKTENQINGIMQSYMGINRYIKMTELPYDIINHIDMHMKLLDEETLLVSRYPDGVADGPQINQNINYVLNNFNSVFNTPYKIKWIDAPPSATGNYPDNNGLYRTYTNSVFINKTVIVPTYRPEVDGPALAYYEELLPGYNIVGIDVDDQGANLISANGAIHCITHAIGVNNPLQIVHQPLTSVNTVVNIPINATIKHRSGIVQAKVFWRVEGTTAYNEVAMTASTDNQWIANINVPQSAQKIQYYIWAEANSGKTQVRPIVAPEGYWTFEVSTLSNEEFIKNQIIGPFPNPAEDFVNFQFPSIQSEIKMTINDITGRILFEKSFQVNDSQLQLNLEQSWSGVLFITFEGNFGQITKKLVKK